MSIKGHNFVVNLRKTKIYINNVDLVNDNVYTKFGLNLSIPSQDMEQNQILTSIRECNSVAKGWAFSALYFAQTSNTTYYLTSYSLCYLNTYVIQIYKKRSAPKGMKGSVLASDIWESNPKLTIFCQK